MAPGSSFHTVAMHSGILCVECKGCGKRSSLTREECRHIYQGNMDQVRNMKFRCQKPKCGSTEVRLYIPISKDEAAMWQAGDRMPEDRRVV